MADAIRVNFSRPMPVFPLPDAVLLPHAVQPLHIFEPRYCQMVNDTLDGTGQIAMACFAGQVWKMEGVDLPTLRPAVCVGQIVQHEALQDGRHNILLQGICRARIRKMIEPERSGHRYRRAHLDPLEAFNGQPPPMPEVREELRELLNGPRLQRMRAVETVISWFDREGVSTHALLELIGFALLKDFELKYRLLAESSPTRRAGIIKDELCSIDDLMARADRQSWAGWPKGMSWN